MSFRATRLVASYEDRSELHFVQSTEGYVWMRPQTDKGKRLRFYETEIVASSDREALAEVRRIADQEFSDRLFPGKISRR
ncbi:hypothetical protein [Desulforhopalus singaporensis]|uniref:Uncharacterized protein n=1 Tax=Desulforhopalus singaporensis TaxID=91360 RepID=A0A1H0NRY2_9BACT|nr:hypothetical protein [Desulforhopalus singaporensis]SDO95393.1 hypothetical protein SAMN05660330_01419 [Desulforhopalus singaporensis]